MEVHTHACINTCCVSRHLQAYGLIDTADKGRRAYSRAHQARTAAPSPIFTLPPRSRTLPDLPLASAAAASAAAGAAAFAHTASSVAGACATCLPPPAAYGLAAASSIAEQQSTAVPVAAAVLDATLFHATASLAIPAVLINRCVCVCGVASWVGGLAGSLGPG